MTRRRSSSDRVPEFLPAALAEPLLGWFRAESRDLPWRRTLDPYGIWVSEIMLQQTQVKTVVPYWERWMRTLPDVAALAAAPDAVILKLWEGLGYYSRARNLKKAAGEILLRHAGRFPENLESVLALPGIGPYTAGAITSIAFNQPSPILDGNVSRVLSRLHRIGGDPKTTAVNRQLWALAHGLVKAAASFPAAPPRSPRRSAGSCSDLNQALMELGATVCTPKKPACVLCPVRPHCLAARSGQAEEFPQKSPRPLPTHRRFIAFIVVRNGMILVRQRTESSVNEGLWEFPNAETPLSAALGPDAFPPYRTESPFAEIKHSITRYRIRLEAHFASLATRQAPPDHEWVSAESLMKLPFSSAHGKLRALLLVRLGS